MLLNALLAKQGEKESQMTLATMYADGEGVKQSLTKAAYWSEKAYGNYMKDAERGDDDSQFTLAFMYQNGIGVTINLKQSAYWYEKSALSFRRPPDIRQPQRIKKRI